MMIGLLNEGQEIEMLFKIDKIETTKRFADYFFMT